MVDSQPRSVFGPDSVGVAGGRITEPASGQIKRVIPQAEGVAVKATGGGRVEVAQHNQRG